jgi:hypothetical protein
VRDQQPLPEYTYHAGQDFVVPYLDNSCTSSDGIGSVVAQYYCPVGTVLQLAENQEPLLLPVGVSTLGHIDTPDALSNNNGIPSTQHCPTAPFAWNTQFGDLQPNTNPIEMQDAHIYAAPTTGIDGNQSIWAHPKLQNHEDITSAYPETEQAESSLEPLLMQHSQDFYFTSRPDEVAPQSRSSKGSTLYD